MRLAYFILLLNLTLGKAFSQNNIGNPFIPDHLKKVIIIQPTGETVANLPEMTVLSDTTSLHKLVIENIENSFINEFLDLYFIAQIYLKNKQKLDNIEPAYLALTENQGGFAKFGFALKEGDNHVIKKSVAYIDITTGSATSKLDKLMSFTQLYPHEMGHVLYHLLSPEDTVTNNTKNVDMHFFSLVTDYSTAFNEGFAEHIENVSRTYEKNETIKSGIFSDIDKIAKTSKHAINGFERDFNYPFRLGYYKASMLGWYQKFEDYKRYEHAFNGDIRYKNASLKLLNIEDQLSYRNSGVGLNKNELRNTVQLHSTEGAISSFFTHLSTSSLSNHYLEPDFYRKFLADNSTVIQSPEKIFTPLQNQFIKYFYVLHRYVVFNNSSKSQLTDFIDGYIQEFPSEENEVKSIYLKALGTEYASELPPPLWLLVKDYPHRLLVFDPFDAITVPIYTFDLNAAETEDLQTIQGFTSSDAEKIIHFRKTNGYFTNLDQIKSIPNLSENAFNKIVSAKFDTKYFEDKLKDFEPKLAIGTLIIKPLKYMYSRAIIYFLLLFGTIYFLLIKRRKTTVKHMVLLFFKYLLLWVLFVFVGLVTVFLSEKAYMYMILFSIFLILMTLLIYRKKRMEKTRTITSLGLMCLAILISII